MRRLEGQKEMKGVGGCMKEEVGGGRRRYVGGGRGKEE